MAFAPRPRCILRVFLIGAACVLVATCQPDSPRTLAESLGRELEGARLVEPRLSISATHRPCATRSVPGDPLPRTECDALPHDRASAVRRVAASASAALRAAPTADALRTTALIDLVYASNSGNTLDRSISSLESAARLSEQPGAILSDLAAAYLVRAERARQPRDLFAAVDAASRALAREPGSPEARFNRALALDRLGIGGEAARAWRAYLAADSTSGWADEARARLRRTEDVAGAPPPAPPENATDAQVADYVRRAPQEAVYFALDRVLGDWARAALSGDVPRASERLRMARTIGGELAGRWGERSVADAVAAIDGSRGDARARVAAAHRDYADGRAAFDATRYPDALASFRSVAEAPGITSSLRGWAGLFQAASLAYKLRSAEARLVITRVVAEADTARHPALAGRARWVRGTILLRGAEYEPALASYRDAGRLLERAGHRQHSATVRYMAADTWFESGDRDAAYEPLHTALTLLRPYRGSHWLHNTLSLAALMATADGYPGATEALVDEDVAVAWRTDIPMYAAEAHIVRARVRASAGDERGAAENAEIGKRVLDCLEPSDQRRWLMADLRALHAGTALAARPRRAVVELDSVVSFFSDPGLRTRLGRALAHRADARLSAGDVDGAVADLDSATAVLRATSSGARDAALRASIVDAGARTVDRLVALHASRGRPLQALAALERGRAMLNPSPVAATEPAALAAPPGEVVLEYAMVGDTLLAWSVRGSAVQMSRGVVDREAFTRAATRVRAALESRAGESAVEQDLSELYEWLILPLRPHLGPPGTPLVVVADGEIAGLPFAALRDASTARYLVQDRPIRFAGSLAEARKSPEPRGSARTALLVADPAFDASAHPGLGRLPGATAEVRAVQAVHPASVRLDGTSATRASLMMEMRRASIIHYAGHAVFDDARPERSFLLLAGPGASGRLSAAEVRGMELGHVRLVVLSACQTLPGAGGRSGGFAGLSGALIAAGAGGVVGSLWRVDDVLTRELMTAFHTEFSASGSGPGALRAAQLRLIRSPDPALRSPAAWAGFRYAGN